MRSIAVCSKKDCDSVLVPPLIYLISVVVISIVAQIYIFTEIKHNFIDRRLVAANIIIDLLILIGGILEIICFLILPNVK